MSSLEELEKRIDALESTQAIRNLKSEYAAACDDNYDPDRLAALFTEDAVWNSDGIGVFEGREAIRNFFSGATDIFSFAIHYSLNPYIEVDGDKAHGRWFSFMPCTAGNKAMWRAGMDTEEYARVDGKWLMKSKTSKNLFSTPFEEGWAKARYVKPGSY